MKKILFLCAVVISINCLAQNAYYDAVTISKFVKNGALVAKKEDSNAVKTYCAILNNYLKNPSPVTSLNTIINEFADTTTENYNPFLKDFFSASLGAGASGIDISSKFAGTILPVGGLDVTNIANGISQFMIKRAKEELTVAFFNRFKKFAAENPEFKVLFPKTTDNLENLLTYKYPDMLPALRTGFLDDLKAITYHLDDVLELPRYQELLKNFPEIKVTIRSIRLVHEIESGETHPADVLKDFAAFKEWGDATASNGFKNFGSSVKLAAIFSQSLRKDISDSQDPAAWIPFAELDELIKNEAAFKIYIGLIYQLVKKDNILFYINDNTVKFDSIMAAQKDNLFLFENKVTEFIQLANKVDKISDTLNNKRTENNALTNDDYYSYIDVSLDVIEYGFSIGKLFADSLDTDEYTKIARKTNDLYRNIYKQEYTQAVSNAMDILNIVNIMVDGNKQVIIKELKIKFPEVNSFKKTFEEFTGVDTTEIKKLIENTALNNKETIALLNKILALYNTKLPFNNLTDVIAKTTKYGLFMANMVNAKTADEVSSVLENAALPVGSSSIKKNSAFNISVQSYLGGFARIGSLKYDNNNAWSSRYGVTAPIGIAFSWGLAKNMGSVSLFASLLDLGAIADYQLKAETVATPDGTDSTVINKDYTVKLGQIFSPGAFVVYGLPWSLPLALGVGGQYGPGLGKIETTGNTIANNPQWRWNIFLAVDIPFFNLANNPKKYKPE